MVTCHPRRASALAACSPTPEEAPVTITLGGVAGVEALLGTAEEVTAAGSIAESHRAAAGEVRGSRDPGVKGP